MEKNKKLGYWDGYLPMVYCYIESDDRLHFPDKIKGQIQFIKEGDIISINTKETNSNETTSEKIYEKYRKGCDFFSNCTQHSWTQLFLDKIGDDICFNNKVVFNKEELDQFKNNGLDEDYEDEIDPLCTCPCESRKKWEKMFPKRLWLLKYISKKDSNYNGIQFFNGNENINVGIDGAWVGLIIPIV